jgi:hypothetical protein
MRSVKKEGARYGKNVARLSATSHTLAFGDATDIFPVTTD